MKYLKSARDTINNNLTVNNLSKVILPAAAMGGAAALFLSGATKAILVNGFAALNSASNVLAPVAKQVASALLANPMVVEATASLVVASVGVGAAYGAYRLSALLINKVAGSFKSSSSQAPAEQAEQTQASDKKDANVSEKQSCCDNKAEEKKAEQNDLANSVLNDTSNTSLVGDYKQSAANEELSEKEEKSEAEEKNVSQARLG